MNEQNTMLEMLEMLGELDELDELEMLEELDELEMLEDFKICSVVCNCNIPVFTSSIFLYTSSNVSTYVFLICAISDSRVFIRLLK